MSNGNVGGRPLGAPVALCGFLTISNPPSPPVKRGFAIYWKPSVLRPLKIPFAVLSGAAPFQTGFLLERSDNTLRLTLLYAYQVG